LELRGVDGYQRRLAADRVIGTVGLTGYGDRYPSKLSGGMQQRVGLARSRAADLAILLMDEPFSALDPLIRRQLQDEFLRLSEQMKKTTLFITHDLDEATRIGDRIAIMKDGHIVQIGTLEQIVTEPAVDHVADFVKGISRLQLVTAARVTERYAAAGDAASPYTMLCPVARLDTYLDELVDIAVASDHPIIIEADGARVGHTTKATLLHGIQGGSA